VVNFLSKGSFDLVSGGEVGGRESGCALGDRKSITFLGTQCLSKVKSDTTKTLKSYAKKHFMKNL
jgi:hypothetical protein